MPSLLAHRVLVIDDTPAIHDDFRKVFQSVTAEPFGLRSAAAALFGETSSPFAEQVEFFIDSAFQGHEGAELVRRALAENQPYSIAFVDMRMPPGWDGLETIVALWKIDPRLQVVICTAHSDRSWHDIRKAVGSSDSLIILKKPFDHSEARQLAHALGQKWALARDNELRLAQLDALLRERTQELKVAEDRFSRAFEANPHAQALIALDPFEILEINPAFTRQFGLTMAELALTSPETFGRAVNGDKWRALLARLQSNEAIHEHAFLFERGPKDLRELRCSASPLTLGHRACSIWLVRDVTEQSRLEKQFLQAQKMEAVGQLAAGIVHDFNNLLTVIQGYTELALDDSVSTDPKPGLMRVRHAAGCAAALTRQLLLFSRRETAKPELVHCDEALHGLRQMLSQLVPERIRVDWSTDGVLPHIQANATNLEQAVMNLVINARDAMPGHGLITITLRHARLGPDDLNRHAQASVGPYVTIAVSDTGTGISPEVMARIFEPFFTTKESGKGTGLGLCTVYGIVDQHGGWVEVASTVGQGSTFTLFFPAVEGSETTRALRAGGEGDSIEPSGRGEHVLIVEDNAEVRSAAVAIATRAGYRVTEAEDGFSALAAWNNSARNVDLIFTDVVMPNGLSGLDLVARLRQDRPDLKAIFTSGYSDQLQNGGPRRGDRVLLKPYAVPDLIAAFRRTLDASPSTPALAVTLF